MSLLQLCSLVTNNQPPPSPSRYSTNNDVPPPLPSRKSLSMQSLSPPPLPPRPTPINQSNTHNTVQSELERHQPIHLTPPANSHGIPISVSNHLVKLSSTIFGKYLLCVGNSIDYQPIFFLASYEPRFMSLASQ